MGPDFLTLQLGVIILWESRPPLLLKIGGGLICHKNESENFICCQLIQKQYMILIQQFHNGIMNSLEIYMELYPTDF